MEGAHFFKANTTRAQERVFDGYEQNADGRWICSDADCDFTSSSKTGVGEAYLLKGHKWFTSAPMSDFFLTLAKVSPWFSIYRSFDLSKCYLTH